MDAREIAWPRKDYSRVPYALYHDADIYEHEMARIFRGPVWLFLGLDAEIPKPGDFRTTWLGDTPVIYNRDDDGRVYAFVNRCAHRGATVCRELYGNTADHTCIYHRWCYDRQGNLIGIPFKRGVGGKGGLAADFDQGAHGLEQLRVESYCGVLFATFSDEPEPLIDYLGPTHAGHLARVFHSPVRVLGYQRQHIHGNWKFYNENLRDQYHGSLLHEFQATFAIARITQEGGAKMDPRHRHSISYTKQGTDSDEEAHRAYKEEKVREGVLTLREPRMVEYHPEYDDGVTLSICSVFPNACFQQISNSLATRQIRPKGIDAFELVFTIFGYESDDEEMTQHRLLQSNLVGPAGLISMEDGEAVEIAHRSTQSDPGATSVIEMGGGGTIPDHVTFKTSDIPIRGFWSYYAELMEIEPNGAIR
jgi:anthranilate 1,2-dioxygenase large subunit